MVSAAITDSKPISAIMPTGVNSGTCGVGSGSYTSTSEIVAPPFATAVPTSTTIAIRPVITNAPTIFVFILL